MTFYGVKTSQIDKFLYSSEDYIKAGAVLAVGVVSRYTLAKYSNTSCATTSFLFLFLSGCFAMFVSSRFPFTPLQTRFCPTTLQYTSLG